MIYQINITAHDHLKKQLHTLFSSMHDTLILTALQGHMGEIWVNDLNTPTAALLIVGDFAFCAGESNTTESDELLSKLPNNMLVITDSDAWKKRIEATYKDYFTKFDRYAFKRDVSNLNPIYIHSFLSTLPEGYALKKVDEEVVRDPSFHTLSPDFTSQFNSIEDYLNRGIGYCIYHKALAVCGASSYSIYDGGIEIEIDTHPEHRRKGLATVAAAALILDCLKQGIYPNWDAANLQSVGLAQKLGYILDKPYATYYISRIE